MKKIVKSLCIVLLLAFVFTASNHVSEVKAATKSEVTYKLKKGTLQFPSIVFRFAKI